MQKSRGLDVVIVLSILACLGLISKMGWDFYSEKSYYYDQRNSQYCKYGDPSEHIQSRAIPESLIFTDKASCHNIDSSWNVHYPRYAARCYDDAARREYIQQHFEPSVYMAYDHLIPHRYQEDFFGLCILYVEGGWLIQPGVSVSSNGIENAIHPDETLVLVGGYTNLDKHGNQDFTILSGVMGAIPKHPFIWACLRLAMKRILTEDYRSHPDGVVGEVFVNEMVRDFFKIPSDTQLKEGFYNGFTEKPEFPVSFRLLKGHFDISLNQETGSLEIRSQCPGKEGKLFDVDLTKRAKDAEDSHYMQLWYAKKIYKPLKFQREFIHPPPNNGLEKI